MSGKSTKTRFVGIRLSLEAYNAYQHLVETSPKNPFSSPGEMMKWVLEWYPFRHTTRKYRKKT